MRIKISAGAERDIADGCDFYDDIDPNLATYFHDSRSADIDSLLLYAGVHAKVGGWHYTFASRFPFVFWYGVIDDLVIVYAVLDGRRDPDRTHRPCVDGGSRTNDSITDMRTGAWKCG